MPRVSQIILSNTFNYFNILNLALAAIILTTGAYKNVLFLGVLLLNTFIAIFQEIRSKLMVERLTLLSKNNTKAMRDGKIVELNAGQIVLDDVIIVSRGDQIPVDCELLDGYLEMDESNLTGESVSKMKKENDVVYSGSVVVSGSASLLVKKVGKDSFVNKMGSQVKVAKIYPSKLRDTMNGILKIVTYAIIPIGILLYLKNRFVFNMQTKELILKTTAPLVGTIPEGLILLTSIALAVSIYALGKKKILVQELYCTESLARVDVLCADKTGTITEGSMEVVETIGPVHKIMSSYLSAFNYENTSDKALVHYFGKARRFEIDSKLDFSSIRKYSAVNFKDEGNYALGAFEFLIKNPTKEEKEINDKYVESGLRLLVLVKSDEKITIEKLPENLTTVGYIILSDVIRENTKEIFDFFDKEGVQVKIISGDNPIAVGAIAKKAGLEDVRTIDVSQLNDEEVREAVFSHNIFGRVSPDQKKIMIEALQNQGHTVAMTGGGVNDVLALKQADVSIAMARGCDAAKQISNIVLLENDFKNLYDILMEGRRVINNIQRVSTLFLNKTAMSVLFAIVTILTNMQFPFIPIQLTLISTLTIGIPGFLLTLEKSRQRIKGDFMKDVLTKSFMSAFILAVATFSMILIYRASGSYRPESIPTMSAYLCLLVGITLVVLTSRPFNFYKILLVGFIIAMTLVVVNFFPDFFQLVSFNAYGSKLVLIVSVLMIIVLVVAYTLYEKFMLKKEKEQKIRNVNHCEI